MSIEQYPMGLSKRQFNILGFFLGCAGIGLVFSILFVIFNFLVLAKIGFLICLGSDFIICILLIGYWVYESYKKRNL